MPHLLSGLLQSFEGRPRGGDPRKRVVVRPHPAARKRNKHCELVPAPTPVGNSALVRSFGLPRKMRKELCLARPTLHRQQSPCTLGLRTRTRSTPCKAAACSRRSRVARFATYSGQLVGSESIDAGFGLLRCAAPLGITRATHLRSGPSASSCLLTCRDNEREASKNRRLQPHNGGRSDSTPQGHALSRPSSWATVPF
jgi:hypothetical protein